MQRSQAGRYIDAVVLPCGGWNTGRGNLELQCSQLSRGSGRERFDQARSDISYWSSIGFQGVLNLGYSCQMFNFCLYRILELREGKEHEKLAF